MTDKRAGMSFRHFFGVRATHIDYERWNEFDTSDEAISHVRGGGFKVRSLTTYTEFVGGEEFVPGEEIVFSFASCPIIENGKHFPASREVGNRIAKGRFDAGNTLTVISEAKSINDYAHLPSALMIARLSEVHSTFNEYTWYKGPLKVSLEVAVEGYAIRDRMEAVQEGHIIETFVCGDGSAYRDSKIQRVNRLERRKASREAKGLPWTPPPSAALLISGSGGGGA